MILVAHRGNITGAQPTRENHPDYVREALAAGYHVEVDVWASAGKLCFGHAPPGLSAVPVDLLHHDRVICHAKNGEALDLLIKAKAVHFFSNDADPYALTSQGYVWTNYRVPATANSICMLLPWEPIPLNVLGVCADNLVRFNGK